MNLNLDKQEQSSTLDSLNEQYINSPKYPMTSSLKENIGSVGDRKSSETSKFFSIKNDILEDLNMAERTHTRGSLRNKTRQIVINRTTDRLSLQPTKEFRDSDPKCLLLKTQEDLQNEKMDFRDEVADLEELGLKFGAKRDKRSEDKYTSLPFVSDFISNTPSTKKHNIDRSTDNSNKNSSYLRSELSLKEASTFGPAGLKSYKQEDRPSDLLTNIHNPRSHSISQDKAAFRIKSISRVQSSCSSGERCNTLSSVKSDSPSIKKREKSISIPMNKSNSIQCEAEVVQNRPRSNAIYLRPQDNRAVANNLKSISIERKNDNKTTGENMLTTE